MTSGEPSGPSVAKLGGYTLIGVGALAAVVGVTTAFTGGTQSGAETQADEQSPSAAPSPEQPQQPSPQQPVPQQPREPQQPPPQQPQQPDPAHNPLPGGQNPGDAGRAQPIPVPRPGIPDGSGQTTPKIAVRVYNNSTIKGLASRAADDVRSAGYDVPEVGNYAAGKIATTTVYFRPGTDEEGQAKQVAERVGARPEPRFEGLQPASPGVIAIITNDYRGPR